MIAVGAVAAILTIAVAKGLARAGMNLRLAVQAATVGSLGVMLGGQLLGSLPGGAMAAVALTALAVAILIYLGPRRSVALVLTWLALSLWLWVGGAVAQAFLVASPSLLAETNPVIPAIDPPRGDAVIAIFDEYPNEDFATTSLDVDMQSHIDALEAEGFESFPNLVASYAFTDTSVPSFFLLDLPVDSGERTWDSLADLIQVMGGESPFVEAFREAGYRVTLVESGWSGLRCMNEVDNCVVRSWYDEPTASVLSRSLLHTPVESVLGDPFTHGVLRTMEWAENHLSVMTADEVDDLIIVHFMLPHRPLAFDGRCRPTEPLAENLVALSDQVTCANHVMQATARATSEASLVILTGDHGTTTRGQIDVPAEEWTKPMVAERMRTFAAVKGTSACSEPEPNTTTNLAVRIIRCLGGREIPYVENRSLATSVHGEPLIEVFP